jgi:prepilin-type N-terminal cleavage/methylation domain-containing protein
MLAVFSMAMVVEAVLAKPPSCGCFGSLKFRIADSFWFAIGRNVILIGMLLPSLAGWKLERTLASVTVESAGESRTGAVEPPRAGRHARPPAFTLIELLVSIAIIAILIAISFPALRIARVRADAAVIRSDLRGHVQIASVYSLDHAGSMPAPPVQGQATYAHWPDEPSAQPVAYFFYGDLWRVDFAERYADGRSFVDPPFTHTYLDGRSMSYLYAASCFSAPVFWDNATPRSEAMLKAQPLASVTYPSQNAMFVSRTQSGQIQTFRLRAPRDPPLKARLRDEPVPLGFADGSASLAKPESLIAPDTRAATGGEWEWLGAAVHGIYTFEGIRGRDVR